MMKLLGRRVPRLIMVATVAILFGGMQLHTAYAAPKDDAMVAVATDVTASSHCQHTFTQNVGSKNERTWQFACQPGDIIWVHTIQRPAAVAAHLPYVELPHAGAPTSEWLKARSQIFTLDRATADAARQANVSTQTHFVNPATACGGSNRIGTVFQGFTSNSWLATFTNYTVNAGCSSSQVGQSGIQQYAGSDTTYWAGEYADLGQWWLYCRTIPHSSSSYTTYTPPSNSVRYGAAMQQQIANAASGGDCAYWTNYIETFVGYLN